MKSHIDNTTPDLGRNTSVYRRVWSRRPWVWFEMTRNGIPRPKDNSPQDNSPHIKLAPRQLAPLSEDNSPHFKRQLAHCLRNPPPYGICSILLDRPSYSSYSSLVPLGLYVNSAQLLSQFYIVKLVFTWVYIFLSFLSKTKIVQCIE